MMRGNMKILRLQNHFPFMKENHTEDCPSKSSSEENDSESSNEGSATEGSCEGETPSPNIGTAQELENSIHPNKRHCIHKSPEVTGFGPILASPKGTPSLRLHDRITDFCKRNKIQLIIRAHECVMDGFERFPQRQLITLFSATNYCGTANNARAILVVGRGLVIVPKLIHPLPPSSPEKSPERVMDDTWMQVLINCLEKTKVVVFKSGVDGAKRTKSGGKEMVVGWELKEVPLRPDPLHHHGASPKKPGTNTP